MLSQSVGLAAQESRNLQLVVVERDRNALRPAAGAAAAGAAEQPGAARLHGIVGSRRAAGGGGSSLRPRPTCQPLEQAASSSAPVRRSLRCGSAAPRSGASHAAGILRWPACAWRMAAGARAPASRGIGAARARLGSSSSAWAWHGRCGLRGCGGWQSPASGRGRAGRHRRRLGHLLGAAMVLAA